MPVKFEPPSVSKPAFLVVELVKATLLPFLHPSLQSYLTHAPAAAGTREHGVSAWIRKFRAPVDPLRFKFCRQHTVVIPAPEVADGRLGDT